MELSNTGSSKASSMASEFFGSKSLEFEELHLESIKSSGKRAGGIDRSGAINAHRLDVVFLEFDQQRLTTAEKDTTALA
jgi:hypothetical protein